MQLLLRAFFVLYSRPTEIRFRLRRRNWS